MHLEFSLMSGKWHWQCTGNWYRLYPRLISLISLRQLQEKCREQGKPLYVAFIDLTKAFNLISRDGLFKILVKVGCPPTLLSIVKSFHDNMKGTVLYNGATFDLFKILSGVKQGCVLAPTLSGIFLPHSLNMLLEKPQYRAKVRLPVNHCTMHLLHMSANARKT